MSLWQKQQIRDLAGELAQLEPAELDQCIQRFGLKPVGCVTTDTLTDWACQLLARESPGDIMAGIVFARGGAL